MKDVQHFHRKTNFLHHRDGLESALQVQTRLRCSSNWGRCPEDRFKGRFKDSLRNGTLTRIPRCFLFFFCSLEICRKEMVVQLVSPGTTPSGIPRETLDQVPRPFLSSKTRNLAHLESTTSNPSGIPRQTLERQENSIRWMVAIRSMF